MFANQLDMLLIRKYALSFICFILFLKIVSFDLSAQVADTVIWKSIKATVEIDKVKITWVTSAETNNRFFAVQKSANGIDFENFEKIVGSGTSTKDITYKSYDYDPYKGALTYYRVLQHCKNGNESYSAIVSTNYFRKSKPLEVELSKEKDEVIVHFWNDEEGGRTIKILDNLGNVLYAQSHECGVELININVSMLKDGLYFVNSKGKNGNKFVKLSLTR